MSDKMTVHFRKDTPDVTVLLDAKYPPQEKNGLYLVRDVNNKLWSFNLEAVTYIELEWNNGFGGAR